MIRSKLLKFLFGSLIILGASVLADEATDYPTGPITLVIPYGAGGMTDVSGRVLAHELEQRLGQRVDVVNQPGAGGFAGLIEALRERPDGHTIISVTTDIFANAVLLDRNFDLRQVSLVGSYMPQERVLFSSPTKPWQTFEEFIDYARTNRVSFADGGALWAGSVVKAMAKEAGIDLSHVPFESGAAGSAALLGGHVDIGETGVGTPAWQAAKIGDLNVIALLSDGDLEVFGYPEVENLNQKGYTYVTRMYYGLAVSSEVPEAIRQKLEDVLRDIFEDPEVVSRFEDLDLTPRFLTGEEYREIAEAVMEESEDLKTFLDE